MTPRVLTSVQLKGEIPMVDPIELETITAFSKLLEEYSNYRLFAEEKYLFDRYYRTGESVLDLACGAGRTTIRLYERGMNVLGIDASETLIRAASIRFPQIKFRVGVYQDTKEPDCSWDHVLVSYNGIDYAHPEESRVGALREFHRVLKPRGTLIFSSHNLRSLIISPYHFRSRNLKFQLKNLWRAFGTSAYLKGSARVLTFYASPVYTIQQTEEQGFQFIEMRGFHQSSDPKFNKWVSPYIHYVFRRRDAYPP